MRDSVFYRIEDTLVNLKEFAMIVCRRIIDESTSKAEDEGSEIVPISNISDLSDTCTSLRRLK